MEDSYFSLHDENEDNEDHSDDESFKDLITLLWEFTVYEIILGEYY